MNSNTPTAPAAKLRVKRADFYAYDPAYLALTQAKAFRYCWCRAIRWKAPKGFRAEVRQCMGVHARVAVRVVRLRLQIRAEADARYPNSTRAA